MVEDRLTDGRRIAQLLASEIDGRDDDELAHLSVANVDRDVEPTVDGAQAYDVVLEGTDEMVNGQPLATVFVHPDRIHLEFERGRDAAVEAAENRTLMVRPKATTPPKTLVFLESGAAVKRGVGVVQAATRAVREPGREDA